MATIPEEFFAEGLMEPPPPSPSIFLERPPTPDGDLVLPYISRKLMEEDIDDEKLLSQYFDHPELLQAQQSFAQILSSPSFCTSNDDTVKKGVTEHTQNTLSSAFSKDVNAVEQFLKGTVEAQRFLPGNSNFKMDEHVNQIFRESSKSGGINKRHNRDEKPEEAGSTKKGTMIGEKLKVFGIHETLDRTILPGYETYIRDMEKLCITVNGEEKKKKKKTKGSSKAARDEVDLGTLLIRCGQEVAMNNYTLAVELLEEIKQHASATGDATQRLAQCFTKGLEARLAGTGVQLWNLLMEEHPIMDLLKAYNCFVETCCFNKVVFNFYSMTIMDAMVGKRRLHIVDYGMHFGFQWAGLIRCLANRDGGPPDVKITAIGRSKHRTYPNQQIEEQWRQLSNCASELCLPFKFHVITKRCEEVCIEDLNKDTDEVLVVNDLCHFSSLMDESVFADSASPRDTVLNNIRKMRPHIFIQSIVNCSYGTSFLSRFREALFYYMALFDMFDATIPRESESRLVLEQGLLGRCALNSVACESVDLVHRPEKYRYWQVRNQRAGLRQLPLKPNIVEVLKEKVGKQQHKDSFLSVDNQWLLQGWMGRVLFAHSTWVAEDAISE